MTVVVARELQHLRVTQRLDRVGGVEQRRVVGAEAVRHQPVVPREAGLVAGGVEGDADLDLVGVRSIGRRLGEALHEQGGVAVQGAKKVMSLWLRRSAASGAPTLIPIVERSTV